MDRQDIQYTYIYAINELLKEQVIDFKCIRGIRLGKKYYDLQQYTPN